MLTIRQLVNAAIKSKRGLTLVVESSKTAEEVYKQLCIYYDKPQEADRSLLIKSVVIRIQVCKSMPNVYNVWYI